MKNPKSKNDTGTDNKNGQKCEQCGGYDIALAAKSVRGRIKWICYNCYRKG